MAFCAWCGNHVQQVSYAACPRCGNPTNGAQRMPGAGSDRNIGIIIGLLVGGLVLVAIVGILAAIAIPNLLTAMQRSRQKRTMADMRSLGTALEAYASDKDAYPEVSSVNDLAPLLTPTYMAKVPAIDGWETPLRYEGGGASYAIGSAGGDKTFERGSLGEYTPETATTDFDNDIVYANGKFVQYPQGPQTGGQ
jgi:type II secretory pathway pseudopilin PulG